jgi:hypothetical protein
MQNSKNSMAVKWATFTYTGEQTKCSTKLLRGANMKILFRTCYTIGRLQTRKIESYLDKFDEGDIYQLI